jgi:outer membrane protein insertion porin family
MNFFRFTNIIFLLLFAASCTIIRNKPPGKPYLVKNLPIELIGGQFNKTEKEAVKTRLLNQLDDSAKVNIVDKFLFFHIIKRPIAFDTAYTHMSAANMQASMYHLGYYNAKVKDTAFIKNGEVKVQYTVTAGKPTLIDTVSYRLKTQELQEIALSSLNKAYLLKNEAVTKTAVQAEINRLVDSFRNNGYYKFTATELKVRGDSSIEALTNISDDPFEQLQSLNEAQRKRDSPTVKLAIVINKPEDSTKLYKYSINKIYVLSDYRPDDVLADTTNLYEIKTKHFIHRYHKRIFSDALLERNITIHTGDVYKQDEYYKTINNLTKLGVWQSININVLENLDEVNKIDLIIELLPGKKFSNENALEGSYAVNRGGTNPLGGNLFGISLNLSLLNKNLNKEAIRMTHNLRGTIEFNSRKDTTNNNIINSNELSYSNNIVIPRLIFPYQKQVAKQKVKAGETFLSSNFAYSNRLGLFSLFSINLNYGYTFTNKKDNRFIFKPLFIEYSNLFNESDTFNRILIAQPFLRYSYNKSFVLGMAAGYSSTHLSLRHPTSKFKDWSFKFNIEESGLTWGLIPTFSKIETIKRYIKLDAEFKKNVTYKKSALALRSFIGVGAPLFDAPSLPFFKQFFGGGSNSMRGWPIRGIGKGGQQLLPFGSSTFNDRTGDMQLELNGEYRHDIIPLFSWLKLKGAFFVDAGNIWDTKKSTLAGATNESVFEFKNLYKQMGLAAGYGFRFDASYAVIRLDFGFRFKRPETSDVNNGWKAPDISFDDGFQKLFSGKYKSWRYENFNFSLGINYPF